MNFWRLLFVAGAALALAGCTTIAEKAGIDSPKEGAAKGGVAGALTGCGAGVTARRSGNKLFEPMSILGKCLKGAVIGGAAGAAGGAVIGATADDEGDTEVRPAGAPKEE